MSRAASHPRRPRSVNRRAVLPGGAALGATAFGGTFADAVSLPGADSGRLTDPSTLDLASGGQLSDGVVLWTRLAPEPTAEDGKGGMPDKVVPVQREVAEDESFSKSVQRGQADAASELGHSVHIGLEDLRPGVEYSFRFRAEGSPSPTGRTRTALAPGSMSELTMCFASCANYGAGHFTAYRRMAETSPA